MGLFGLVGQCRLLLPHTGSATGHLIAPGDHHTLQHIQVHFGVDFQADFEDVRWHNVALTWNHTKDHNRSRKPCFHHPGHVPVIRDNPDLHFEGAGNGPVFILWIGREHEFYSGTSPISLVEHCVTFRHDRRLQSLLGFVHNWQTCRWASTKKENRFSLNENGIMWSFLGGQFYRSVLYMGTYRHIGMKTDWLIDWFWFQLTLAQWPIYFRKVYYVYIITMKLYMLPWKSALKILRFNLNLSNGKCRIILINIHDPK